jgi:hypothetical protein
MRSPGGRTDKLLRLPRFNGQGSLGTLPQAGPQPVTKTVGQQLRLAVHDLNGPFGARWYAQAAAVTLFLIYPNYLSFSHESGSLVAFRVASIRNGARRRTLFHPVNYILTTKMVSTMT